MIEKISNKFIVGVGIFPTFLFGFVTYIVYNSPNRNIIDLIFAYSLPAFISIIYGYICYIQLRINKLTHTPFCTKGEDRQP